MANIFLFDTQQSLRQQQRFAGTPWLVQEAAARLQERLEDFQTPIPIGQSVLEIQTINDVPSHLKECYQATPDGGAFMAVFLGGESLRELRTVLAEADMQAYNGLHPRVIPMIDVKSAAKLWQQAGFVEVVSNVETLTLTYPTFIKLCHDIRAHGASNTLIERRKAPTSRAFFAAATAAMERYRVDDKLHLTIELIYCMGFK